MLKFSRTFIPAFAGCVLIAGVFSCAIICASTEPELVKNGAFSSSTLTNWTLQRKDSANVSGQITGGAYVITRAANAAADDTNSWNIQFSHKAISLEKGRSYVLTFKVKADSAFTMQANVGMNKDPWSTYSGYQQFAVKNAWDSMSLEFTMTEATDDAARVVFDFGAMRKKGTISLDNVSLKALAVSAGGELVRNGDFSSTSVTSWAINLQKGAAATRSVVDGKLVVDITKFVTQDSTAERYYVQLQQTGIKLQKGLEYEIKFHAKCDSTYQIMVYTGMNKDPWANYSGWSFQPMLSPQWDSSYSTTFTMDSADDAGARLVFDIGDAGSTGARKVYFDNISIKSIGGTPVQRTANGTATATEGYHPVFRGGNLEIRGVASPVSVQLFNAAGSVVAELPPANASGGAASFSIPKTIARGVYVVRIQEVTRQGMVRSGTARFIRQ